MKEGYVTRRMSLSIGCTLTTKTTHIYNLIKIFWLLSSEIHQKLKEISDTSTKGAKFPGKVST